MRSERLPYVLLALLLAVAACVVAGGATLSRCTETVRVARDRAAARNFASLMEEQLRRLERLYDDHLGRIADAVVVNNLAASKPQCEAIVGIGQLSLLRPASERTAEQHVIIIKPPLGEEWPQPTLRVRSDESIGRALHIPHLEIFSISSARTGWIDREGFPLIYWQRRDWENVAVVLSISREEVRVAIDGWLRAWVATAAASAFARITTEGASDRLIGADASILGGARMQPAQLQSPDFLLPIRGRFGRWQIASWDPVRTGTRYHLSTVVAAVGLGLFTALLGVGVFSQQRRAAALAAQRVSFVNRVSHELRTPLTNILLNLDLATESQIERSPEAATRLDLVREEVCRLGRLIDNVLTFSRRERRKLHAEPRACIPGNVLAAVLAQFAPSFQRRGFEIRCSGELGSPCFLDADAFAQILANLLSNVEKYVPGGIVEIVGTVENDALAVVVRDHGPGIPREAAEDIFRPFQRLDARVNEGVTGTGLGLAIARDLAASMGGSLHLRPCERGASFELRVPAPKAVEPVVLGADAPSAMRA